MDGLTPKWGSIGGNSRGSAQSSGSTQSKSKKQAKKRPAPFSLRLSFDEKQKLIEDAGRQSISAYIKARLFDPDTPVKQARGLNPVKDQKALAQLLGMLAHPALPRIWMNWRMLLALVLCRLAMKPTKHFAGPVTISGSCGAFCLPRLGYGKPTNRQMFAKAAHLLSAVLRASKAVHAPMRHHSHDHQSLTARWWSQACGSPNE
ncbi:hypothetical protein [Iodidimonas gelatinilytica]|uniref:hypothetical protein n=1 Tax=Iodidimonas gelatinilytica TaxID=1236966 RepID=UPI00123054CE|nr:hypothetical protein [Iodidimonas gelatinilytica]